MTETYRSVALSSYAQSLIIQGKIEVAPDKSISHRALIFSALANGSNTITNLLEGEDVLRTAAALRLMGAQIHKDSDGIWHVKGVGVAGLQEPNDILDMGNSGTAARLLMGLVTPFNFTTFFNGDASLRKRPMGRVFEPLREIGAKIHCRGNNLLPAAIIGTSEPMPISYEMKMASAQVKSAILLCALNIPGLTTIIEPEKCRDHTEIMMRYLGLKVTNEDMEIKAVGQVKAQLGTKITFEGGNDFYAKNFTIPGDISSAAFIIVAALIIPGSDIIIKNVGINPLRSGIIQTLQEMGADIEICEERSIQGESVADIRVKSSVLKGIDIPAHRAPSMIDEYPILAVAAANAHGITKMNGLAELKVKESNRLSAIASGLNACGVKNRIGEDDLEITGGIKQNNDLVKINTYLDHRIAMSFLIMGFVLKNGLQIDDYSMIKTSFPNFLELFAGFGANFKKS